MRSVLATLAAATLALSFAPDASAKRIYQYRDANGVLHFTDEKPADPTVEVKEQLVTVDQQTLVDFQTLTGDRQRQLAFSNRIAGPIGIEVVLVDPVNVSSEPPMPARAVLEPHRQTIVATVRPIDPYTDSSYTVSFRAVPGDPNAMPNRAYRYGIPLPPDSGFQLHQGPNGSFSHQDVQAKFAVDLAVDEGTPVLAARDGIVMQVEDDFSGAGIDEKHLGRANNVRVLHEDGSMAVYAHLELESAIVTAGQRVRRGQVLAKSGNTGFSTGPHLHFAVQVNSNMLLESIPFEFDGLAIP